MDKLCKIRDLQRSIIQFEINFEKRFGVSLNEGMALCTLLKNKRLSSGEISELLGLTTSNASKIIKSVENKGYVKRVLGEVDKRQMYFTLTDSGTLFIESIKSEEVDTPPYLEVVLERLFG